MKTSHTLTIALSLFAFNLGLSHNELDQPTELSINVISIIPPTCNGGSDGTAKIEAVGGQAPYTFLWNTFPNQHTSTAQNLTAGVYFIYVTDANDSTYSKSIEVSNPTKSTIITDHTIESELKCTVTGLNAPYTIEIDGMTPNDSIAALLFDDGIHQIKITDVNGCEAIQYVQVVEQETEISGLVQIVKSDEVLTSKLIPVIIDPTQDFYSSTSLASTDK